MDSITEILKNEETWFQLFDIVRIIESGGTHRVLCYHGKENFDKDKPCYSFWNQDEHCANCISKRASCRQKPMMKLEYRNNKYYCVLAKPIEVNGEKCILELIMNISDQIKNDEEDGYIKEYLKDLTDRLNNVSSKDSFTGLYNKAYMKEMYDNYVSDSSRSKVFMALLDMDKFKTVNDSYGHDRGDKVLLGVAGVLNKVISDKGIAARFGGDEFGILFASEDENECRSILDKAKEEIDKVQYCSECGDFAVSISYGLADVKDTDDFYEAIHKVDKQLYDVKRSGR